MTDQLKAFSTTQTFETKDESSFLSSLLNEVIEATQQRSQGQTVKSVSATAVVEQKRAVDKPKARKSARKPVKKAKPAKKPGMRWTVGMIVAVTYEETEEFEGGTHMGKVTEVRDGVINVDLTIYDGREEFGLTLRCEKGNKFWDVRDGVPCTVAKANGEQQEAHDRALQAAAQVKAEEEEEAKAEAQRRRSRRYCTICGKYNCNEGPFAYR